MIANLELRHLIESSFLPMRCICTVNNVGTMTVQLVNPETEEIDLTVPGIPVASLITMRSISTLVAQIREEYRLTQLAQKEAGPKSGRRG